MSGLTAEEMVLVTRALLRQLEGVTKDRDSLARSNKDLECIKDNWGNKALRLEAQVKALEEMLEKKE